MPLAGWDREPLTRARRAAITFRAASTNLVLSARLSGPSFDIWPASTTLSDARRRLMIAQVLPEQVAASRSPQSAALPVADIMATTP